MNTTSETPLKEISILKKDILLNLIDIENDILYYPYIKKIKRQI